MKSFTVKDHVVSGEAFVLEQEPGLELLRTRPVPSDLGAYYQTQDYLSHTDETRTWIDKLYRQVKLFSQKRKIRLIQPYLGEKARTLDVGAGTGDFVRAGRDAGWVAQGVEPSARARAVALQKDVVLQSSLDEVQGKFHLVTLWHVLEHLPDMRTEILRISGMMEKDGILVLALPNYKSWDAQHYKEFWAAYDVPRHLWHFSQQSVRHIFEGMGMKLIKTSPLWFDAYYVALLSEKYRNGKAGFLKALLKGSWSNLHALFSGEYSSLIYVFRGPQTF